MTQSQLNAFEEQRQEEFMHLDKELENTMGRKERSIGALRQDGIDHKCQQ